jgi:lysophospholipase L1-like esterase
MQLRDVIELENEDHRTVQGFYRLADCTGLRPNTTFIIRRGEHTTGFETNTYGLRGAEPDPSRKLVVVWGDSIIFGGHGTTWIDMLDAAIGECQFLNGGLEGDPYANVLRRALAVNARLSVDVNIVMPGWHPLRECQTEDGAVLVTLNDGLETRLAASVQALPGCILSTVPTVLNQRALNNDFDAAITAPCKFGNFTLWNWIPSEAHRAKAQLIFDGICERNEIIRRVAAQEGLPLLDWAALMDTTGAPDIREHFFDKGHPRRESYSMIASLWERELRRILGLAAT